MPNKIDLVKAGDSVTMHVVKCEVVESPKLKNKDGTPQEQVKFTDTRGDYVFIGRAPADRELLRCGFGEGEGETATVFYGDVDGCTLVISRVANKNPTMSPYWNIERIVTDTADRPSLAARAKAEAERVRQEKNLPPDDDVPPPTDADAPMDDGEGNIGDLPGDPIRTPARTAASARADKIEQIHKAYLAAWSQAVEVQGDFGTPESVQAGAATLLIAYGKAGLI